MKHRVPRNDNGILDEDILDDEHADTEIAARELSDLFERGSDDAFSIEVNE